MTFDLKKYLSECLVKVDAGLDHFLPGKNIFPQKLHEAMRYSLFAGGKRIRPILCIAAAEACGGSLKEALPIACALEMIHTFSLIHDDLPAMDNDNFRRGMPTNHRVYGEAMAILGGDALLSEAFVVLGQIPLEVSSPSRVLEIITDIALATGSQGMVGGQVIDMESEGKKLNLDQLKVLHRLKTGRLITVSVTSGAKIACQDNKKIKALESYGEAIGLAFQIADDILDIEGGEELGKDIGSDVENNKATYPSLMGLQEAKAEALACYKEALRALEIFGEEGTALKEIARYVIERKK